MHEVREAYPDWDIYSLFFDYGQPNVKEEKACAEKIAEKVEATFYEIKLPEFYWTRSDFYSNNIEYAKDYCVEMRNMVFLSYALSLAEAIQASEVSCAILECHRSSYYDTSRDFIEKMEEIYADKGVVLNAPFLYKDKSDLFYTVVKFNITEEDYFSCNSPNVSPEGNLIPCGKCGDCRALREIMKFRY